MNTNLQDRIADIALEFHNRSMEPDISPEAARLARLQKAAIPAFVEFLANEASREPQTPAGETFTTLIIMFGDFIAKYVASHSHLSALDAAPSIAAAFGAAYEATAMGIAAYGANETQNDATDHQAPFAEQSGHD